MPSRLASSAYVAIKTKRQTIVAVKADTLLRACPAAMVAAQRALSPSMVTPRHFDFWCWLLRFAEHSGQVRQTIDGFDRAGIATQVEQDAMDA